MKNQLKAFVSFLRLSKKLKLDAFLVIIIYLKVSYIVGCYPLKKYYYQFFQNGNKEYIDLMPYKNDINLVQKVIKYMPGKHTCLKESIIVHLFLKGKGIDIPLYLGVSTKNEFQAHAWYNIERSTGFKQL